MSTNTASSENDKVKHNTDDKKDTGSTASKKSSTRVCGGCYKPDTVDVSMQRCGRCKSQLYCSRECQVRHWPIHKPMCEGNVIQSDYPSRPQDSGLLTNCTLHRAAAVKSIKRWIKARQLVLNALANHASGLLPHQPTFTEPKGIAFIQLDIQDGTRIVVKDVRIVPSAIWLDIFKNFADVWRMSCQEGRRFEGCWGVGIYAIQCGDILQAGPTWLKGDGEEFEELAHSLVNVDWKKKLEG